MGRREGGTGRQLGQHIPGGPGPNAMSALASKRDQRSYSATAEPLYAGRLPASAARHETKHDAGSQTSQREA